MNKIYRPMAAVLAAVLLIAALGGCELTKPVEETPTPTAAAPTPSPSPTPEPKNEALMVACSDMGGDFSPFTAESGGDLDVVGMTQLSLLTLDRSGAVVMNAIEGETIPYNGTDYDYTGPADISVTGNFNGTSTLHIRLRDDLLFSDGEPVTVDDLIFNYYVYLDPSYTGPGKPADCDVVGLRDYQTGTPSALYDEYAEAFDKVYNDGAYGDDARVNEVKEAIRQAWIDSVQYIVDYCAEKYMSYAKNYTSFTPKEIQASEGLQIMFGMYMWGFADFNDDGSLVGSSTGKTWDLKSSFPTIEDFYNECYEAYAGDPVAYWNIELGTGTDVVGAARNSLVSQWAAKDPGYPGPVTSISGLSRVDDYSLDVTVNNFSVSDIYSLCGFYIAPLHYYGDESRYDTAAGSYGFPFGDVSGILSNKEPMGAGPYAFLEYTDGTASFKASGYYWKGEPVTESVRLVQTAADEKITDVMMGSADLTLQNGGKSVFQDVRSANDNGELSGDVVTASGVDYPGYGYIGLNADTVNVGGDPGSEASRNLRRAFATLFSVYRDAAVTGYWGDAARVINYPICAVSWAAPKSGDAGYRAAYSLDIQGKDLLGLNRSAEERNTAALDAAIGFFKAAGFTWDETQGKFTEAPEGAKLSYEAMLQGYGVGDHPSYRILSDAAAALSTIGITLSISDVEDSRALLSRMSAGTQEIWAAAWDSAADPDMYWTWHSDSIPWAAGTGTNYFGVSDSRLDALILDARRSTDRIARKAAYATCFGLILDWACILPVYQRQDLLAANTDRVNTDTLPKNPTPYWSWLQEIQTIALR
jgi:peptide/nickel transport system substrate-binding protein